MAGPVRASPGPALFSYAGSVLDLPSLTLATADTWVYLIIAVVGFLLSVFALLHAAVQRADAFIAADRRTKATWVGITGAALLGMLVGQYIPFLGFIIWVAAWVAVLVYLVDVRPAVVDVQRGPRW